ncbi:MAG TPA: arylsulfatase [Lacunisphaera sp.]|jgi:arylsulfatase
MPHALSRREFLRQSALSAASLYATSLTRAGDAPLPAAGKAKQNVIMILADDMGFSDIGCYGSEIHTPNLNRLASTGVRFNQAYNTARCCPSRASLLTGLYSHQAGIGHMVGNYGVPAYQGYLRNDCVTVAEVMREAGYRTWMSGKWHVGGNQAPDKPSTWHPGAPDQPTPLDRGFDRFFGTLGGAGSYYRPPLLMDQGKFITPDQGFYYTNAIGDHACSMIEEATDAKKPFFGYVAFTSPHWPLHALPEDIEKYRTRYRAGWDVLRAERHEGLRKAGIIGDNCPLSPRDEKVPAWDSLDAKRQEWESLRMATYAAIIDRMDQNIGHILDCLEKTGQRDNTLIIFASDNGGSEELLHDDGSNVARYHLPTSHGTLPRMGNIEGLAPGPEDTFMSYGRAWANASDTPFRQFKKWVHEGGISTPLIVNYPSYTGTRGRIAHDPCHFIDILPTIMDFTGATHPSTYHGRVMTPLAGRSILPAAATGSALAPHPYFWEHSGNRAVRIGDMKLVADNERPWELYDLAVDRTELNDLIASRPAEAVTLENRYQTWADSVGVIRYSELEKKFRIPKE